MTVKVDGSSVSVSGFSVSVSITVSKDLLDERLRVSCSGVWGRDVVREEAWV